jgi:hypothetical protein
VQQVVVPSGATRLFLGTMDGCCWNNNYGAHDVEVISSKFSGPVFQNIVESSSTDPTPLFGPPTQFPGGLNFDPRGFVATTHDGGIDMTDGQLSFMVRGSGGIQSINFSEAGDYTLLGEGAASTQALLTATASVVEVNGVPVAPIALSPSVASVNFSLPDNLGVVQPWSLGSSLDVAGQMPTGQRATKVNVVVDNKLTATSTPGTIAFIAKKEFIVTAGAMVPEPSAAAIGVWLVGSLALALRGTCATRPFHVAKRSLPAT